MEGVKNEATTDVELYKMEGVENEASTGVEFYKLECSECSGKFMVDGDYMGVVTCPYCGNYVSG